MSRGAWSLTQFDVVLLRQDPPFDLAYVTTTHLLERIHPKTLVVNDPAHVRNAPEKMMVTEFPDLMPPTLVTRDLAEIKAFRAEHADIVMKPLYGHGGGAVFRITRDDLNFGSLYDMFSVTFREQWVVQKFLPAVKQGDKRILLVDGEFAGAVNRIPAADDLRSNMVRGGAPAATDLTAREREICKRLGPALRERGMMFVGIDVIGDWLTEINVTSPTGIRAVKNLGGPDAAALVWDVIEKKRKKPLFSGAFCRLVANADVGDFAQVDRSLSGSRALINSSCSQFNLSSGSGTIGSMAPALE